MSATRLERVENELSIVRAALASAPTNRRNLEREAALEALRAELSGENRGAPADD